MKYALTWSERPQASPIEYENAQKRILEVFTRWKAPANFKIELFGVGWGTGAGYMVLDCDGESGGGSQVLLDVACLVF